jgi:hypothetical protein
MSNVIYPLLIPGDSHLRDAKTSKDRDLHHVQDQPESERRCEFNGQNGEGHWRHSNPADSQRRHSSKVLNQLECRNRVIGQTCMFSLLGPVLTLLVAQDGELNA